MRLFANWWEWIGPIIMLLLLVRRPNCFRSDLFLFLNKWISCLYVWILQLLCTPINIICNKLSILIFFFFFFSGRHVIFVCTLPRSTQLSYNWILKIKITKSHICKHIYDWDEVQNYYHFRLFVLGRFIIVIEGKEIKSKKPLERNRW